ncbi:hypothetical protein M8C21_008278 [Ambrosia artemisiifolia]|uniref:BHLH domain-containing protein n=1 Tax=Ambrosia artemisiifolia TaxID=4212 RepID=A0AAD5D4K0_AMBAR|nr:hypothetical protein M8C21_008278 [Ambrosia artemisiifolia]
MQKENIFTNEGNGIPQAWNSIFGIGIQGNEGNGIPSLEWESNCVINSIDQRDIFESSLTSIISSPANSGTGIPNSGSRDNIILKELIGRLGSICNSSDISHITTSSCYNTPLNSPQKVVNMSITDHNIHGNGNHQFPLAKYSSLVGKNDYNNGMESGKLSRVSTETGIKGHGNNNNININNNGRKRKEVAKGKGNGKETQSSSTLFAKDDKVVAEVEKEESDAKRSKSNDGKKSNEKSTEPPKDYIHVRARRGQATDSHSLAERVRREKISERMKFLQDLVPGCNKVTGKAVMLDEIINYVQSLQRQVEMFRPQVVVPNNVDPFDTSVHSFPYAFHSQINSMILDRPENQFSMNPLVAAMHRNSTVKPSHIDGFGEASTLWENDLQSVVKMALGGQDQPQDFHGQMKVEL